MPTPVIHMPTWVTVVIDWMSAAPLWAGVAGAGAAGVLAVALVHAARAARGHGPDARATAGFAVVQTGLAYVTITGGYEFWANLVKMPDAEAWLIAGFVEACVWASVGMIFMHGRAVDPDTGKPTTGFGDAAPLFWLATVGGGILAILGSKSLAVALGRTVIVILGGAMWYQQLLRKTRRSEAPPRWRITPRQLMLQWGWLRAEATDVIVDADDWQVRRMARAIRRKNDGWWLVRRLGDRALTRYADGATADVLTRARQRYAFGYVLRTEVAPDAGTMGPVVDAARRSLLPSSVPDDPTPVAPREARKAPEPPAGSDPRVNAERWAYEQVGNPEVKDPTARDVGARYAKSEEWGRLRLVAARRRRDEEAAAVTAPRGQGVPAPTAR